MPFAEPHLHGSARADGKIRVAVLVPAQTMAGLPPQAVRLLAELLADAEFAIRVFAASAPVRELLSPTIAPVLAVERWAIPLPRRNALPVLPAVAVEPSGAARQAAWDIIVDLGGGAADTALADAATHGLWRIVAQPLRAALASCTFTEAVLVRYDGDKSEPRVIARAVYDTKPLATHNAAYVTEKSAQMILREIKRCARDGVSADLGLAETVASGPAPGAFGYFVQTAAKTLQRLRRHIATRRGQFPQGFSLRLGHGSALDFDPAAARPVPMPEVALRADPFLIAHDGAVHCFFEDVDPKVGHGHIGVGRVTETGLSDVRPALRMPHHMSYPFVFHHEGALMMMPEVHAAGRLEIWRCTNFPDRWELHATAFEGTPVADSVLFDREGEWWLFTHISRDSFGDFCSDLHVFRVDGPQLTGLVPHRLNPVVTDASTARGGGRILNSDGRLLRYSQDNSGGSYGHALNVMEIVHLDLDHYEERRVRHITADFTPGLIGCHHFDALDGWFMIDVRKA
ncbi:MAG: hypothetical protein ABI832_12295 [bacterium]